MSENDLLYLKFIIKEDIFEAELIELIEEDPMNDSIALLVPIYAHPHLSN